MSINQLTLSNYTPGSPHNSVATADNPYGLPPSMIGNHEPLGLPAWDDEYAREDAALVGNAAHETVDGQAPLGLPVWDFSDARDSARDAPVGNQHAHGPKQAAGNATDGDQGGQQPLGLPVWDW